MLKTSDGLEVDIVSSNFQVISHQSQLPSTKISQDKKKAKKRKSQKRSKAAEVLTIPPGIIDFGLLSDAAIKAESVKVESLVSDSNKSKRFLLERADNLALRICALQEEELILRQQAAEVYESSNE